MLMRKILILLTILFLPLSAYAGKIYTGQDLQQYKQPGDDRSTQSSEMGWEKEESLTDKFDKISEEENKDYWCKESTYHENRVDDAMKNFNAAEDNLNKTDSDFFMKKARKYSLESAKRRLNQAKEKLERAKRAKSQFEDRAYRQNVPASWLRCQYN